MNKGLAIILATASAGTVAVPATAQDDSTFTGPRVEVLGGYDILRPGSTQDIDNNEDVDQTIEDVAYGVGIGYDMAVGGAVVGVEGEWMQSEASTRYDTQNFAGFGISNLDAGRDLYVGVRAGILATPSTLVYAKGGYANASMRLLSSDNVTEVGKKADLDGWRIGAGVEQAVTPNLFIKGEYRYSNYQEGEFEAPSGLESDRFNVDLDRHQVVVGVGYRF